MAGPLVTSIADGSKQLGRYFSIVNGIPSAIALLGPLTLVASGAPRSAPNVHDALAFVDKFDSLGRVALLLVGVLATGLLLYPLQFATTQFLEGYWGTSTAARRAMTRSIRANFDRFNELVELVSEADAAATATDSVISDLEAEMVTTQGATARRRIELQIRELTARRVAALVDLQEGYRAGAAFPESAADLMPTRLGNMLRRYERIAGRPYGIDAVRAMPYIAQVADPTEREYHDDARSALDLSVRMTFVWAFLTASSAVLLWAHGPWLAIPVCCSALSYLSYRGAVAAARHYGMAMMVLISLSRFTLYERLGIMDPRSLADELAMAPNVNALLAGSAAHGWVGYRAR